MSLARDTSSLTALVFAVFPFLHGQVPSQAPPAQGQPQLQPGQVQPGQAQVQPGTTQTVPGGINQTPWFDNPQLRRYLQLNDNQYNGLNKAYQDAWTRYNQGVSGLDKNLPEAQRQQQMRNLQQNFYKDYSTASGQALTDPAQRQRFEQLGWQYRGFGAFSDPNVASKLQLSQDQLNKLNQYHQDWTNQMGKLGGVYQNNPQQANEQFSKMLGEHANQLNSVLTPQQQAMWGQMAGNPYPFGPEAYFRSNTVAPPPVKK
jgi:hypothetical protein